MNLADLPWRPMDSVPKGIWVVVHRGLRGDFALSVLCDPWVGPLDVGWLTLAEFNKLVNGEDAGI